MAKFLSGRKKRLVLDIGSSCLRLCELSQTKAGYQLNKFYQKEYNSDPALDEPTRKALRKEACAALLKEAKVRHRKTIFGVPGQSVFTRTRALPPVPEYKVTQIVRYEIQQQIPFSLDQIAMDYQILARTDAGGYEVMMAAIKVDVVDKHIEVLESAKRVVDVVDVCPLAAYNWIKHTGEFGDGSECVAMVDIGAATTDIVIEREGQFRFTRPLNIGGNDVTLAVAGAFGLNFKDAEKIKRERGFAPTGDAKVDGKGGEVIGQVLQRLTGEIMRSFAYFRSLPGGGQVNRVVVCGGGACLRNIVPYMQRALGMDVRIAQPLAGLAIAPTAQEVSERPEQACVALGLALRCLQPVALEINLIPPRVLEAARRKEQAFYWALSLTTLALIMASVIPVKANENKAVLERIQELKGAISQYDKEVMVTYKPDAPVPPSRYKQEFGLAKADLGTLQNDVQILDQAWVNRMFWLEQLALINSARPPTGGIWFDSVQTSSTGDAAAGAGAGQPNAPRARPGGNERRGDNLRNLAGVGGSRPSAGGAVFADPFGAKLFPGIQPNLNAALDNPRANRNAPPTAPQELPSTPIQKANTITVSGYALTDTIINEFVENLKVAARDLPDPGVQMKTREVMFSEGSVKKYPISILADTTQIGQNQNEYAGAQSVFSFQIHVTTQRVDTSTAPVAEPGPAAEPPPAPSPVASNQPAGTPPSP